MKALQSYFHHTFLSVDISYYSYGTFCFNQRTWITALPFIPHLIIRLHHPPPSYRAEKNDYCLTLPSVNVSVCSHIQQGSFLCPSTFSVSPNHMIIYFWIRRHFSTPQCILCKSLQSTDCPCLTCEITMTELWLKCHTFERNLVVQHPAKILEVAVVEEYGGVGQDPSTQLPHAHGPNLRHPVPVAVHKYTLEDGIHDRTQLWLVL